ncbi:S4 domain-containing protein [Isoptericola sp. b441]|uniref:S4 domain-containing protein n=1 Tax=Actinotalea lenta TaxID=3064654 RepID=A0ABT9D7U3_9CELL|nr:MULTISPECIES: S4 domain-containing protein [unclassified Isoptericola]MDO8106938.1 S4 domain-containing protein [Isoptericola sp. b441]MDO8121352.1 S4 domain-containing protein [Isoptericola sp. b490]
MSQAQESPAKVRVDAWIWSVRLTPTRTAAATACRAGHVRVNGDRAKPATLVAPGDEVRVLLVRRGGESLERIVRVRRLLTKRVSAAVAAEALEDHTPPPAPREERPAAVAVRERGSGRPTKRERRAIDRLRGR